MQPNIILIDWDGTVIDNHERTYHALKSTLEHFTKREWREDEVRPLVGQPDNALFPQIFGENSAEALQYYYAQHKAIEDERIAKGEPPPLMPGATEFMAFLKRLKNEKGVFVGVVSNKPQGLLEEEVRELHVEDTFHSLVGSDHGRNNKPHTDAYDLALSKWPDDLKKPPMKNTLYIGDTGTDKVFADNIGAKFIGVGPSFKPGALAAEEKAENLDAVTARLQRTFNFTKSALGLGEDKD